MRRIRMSTVLVLGALVTVATPAAAKRDSSPMKNLSAADQEKYASCRKAAHKKYGNLASAQSAVKHDIDACMHGG